MIKTTLKVAALATLMTSAGAMAEMGSDPDTYEVGDTVLSVEKDKYKIEVRSPLVNPGNSTRVYFRPRNGNCTSGFQQNSISRKINNDPMCNNSEWGYSSIDLPEKKDCSDTSTDILHQSTRFTYARIFGTSGTYDIIIECKINSSGQVYLKSISADKF